MSFSIETDLEVSDWPDMLNKAIKVIKSCETEEQLKAAFRYCNRFREVFEIMAMEEEDAEFYKVDEFLESKYEILIEMLHEKKEEICDVKTAQEN